ncbi:hypothetical protein AGMMS49546_28740 [Spirochaetia bacterium]|nr:hypothetical protein AGMMS49546_28740 [Spirochaetia bacterium]
MEHLEENMKTFKRLIKKLINRALISVGIDKKFLIKIIPKTSIDFLVIPLNLHCNLNCAYCNVFCPLISEEEYYEINHFDRDLKRLAEITKSEIKEIRLSGGELLLNKDINKYMVIVRKYFPKSLLCITTNGTLLLKMNEDFWNTCRDKKIKIIISKYPIKLDYENIIKKTNEYGIVLGYSYDDILKKDKNVYTMQISPLNFNGNEDERKNFLNCPKSGGACNCLYNGKIYPCSLPATIHIFNKYFNKSIPVSERDALDINNVKDIKEISEFLAKPIPFCKYCDIDRGSGGYKWKVSEKNIKEWT